MKDGNVVAKLLERNIINIEGGVDGRMAEYVRGAIMELTAKGNPPCKMFITSQGGSVTPALHIYDAFACYPSEVEGIVLGYAESMAVVILQACSRRICLPHSRILIHHVSRQSISLDVFRDERRYKEILHEMEQSQACIDQILSRKTGKSLDEIREACERDEHMSAKEALEFGLIDEIAQVRADLLKK